MAGTEEAITRVTWCDQADQAFASHPDTADDLASIRSDVIDDQAQLWRFTGPADMWLVTRLERYANGDRELVLVNAIGSNSRLVLSVCDRMARQAGAQSLRAHLKNPALMRIFRARGWYPDRTIYKKAVTDVQ